MGERIFYCPTHGRVTEAQYAALLEEGWFGPEPCVHCAQWYWGTVRFKSKRIGES